MSITLPRVSRTYKVDSPALNQAHPVSPCIKPQCSQSCLLDCTGWFTSRLSSVYSTVPDSHSLCYSCRVFVRLCLFQSVPVPSPSVLYRLIWIDPRSPLDYDSCPPSMYLSPVTPGLDPRQPTDPTLITYGITVCRLSNFGLSDYSVVFAINHWFLPELGFAIGFCSLALTACCMLHVPCCFLLATLLTDTAAS